MFIFKQNPTTVDQGLHRNFQLFDQGINEKMNSLNSFNVY